MRMPERSYLRCRRVINWLLRLEHFEWVDDARFDGGHEARGKSRQGENTRRGRKHYKVQRRGAE